MTSKCKGVFGFLFGHDITDVYDEAGTPPDARSLNLLIESPAFYASFTPELFLEELKASKSTYVRSYCERCGQQIERLE